MILQYINSIDWNQVSVYWIIFEQILASSDTKPNSTFQLLIAIVNAIMGVFQKEQKLIPKIKTEEEINIPK
jgi:hypothetical protein